MRRLLVACIRDRRGSIVANVSLSAYIDSIQKKIIFLLDDAHRVYKEEYSILFKNTLFQ